MSLKQEIVGPKLLCTLLIILGHQYLAQAAQGFMVLAEPISSGGDNGGIQNRQAQNSNSNQASNGQPFGSGLVELSMSGVNPYFLQTLFPQTFPAIQSDLTNNYKFLADGAQNGFNGFQTGFQYLNDNTLNHYNKLQQGFTANYLNGEELVRKMYEMLSNPQQMCSQLAAQSQAAMKAAGQLPQQVSQSTGASLNQVAQSSDSLLGSVGNMLSGKPTSTLFNKLGSFSMGKK